MNKSEINELREALMEAHIGDSSESLEELKYYNTPNISPDNTRPEAFAPISMGSQRPITGNKRSRSAMDSGLSLSELQKQLGHHSDSSDDEMKGYNKAFEKEKRKKRRTVKLRGKKRGGKRKKNRKKRTRRRRKKGGHAGNTSSSGRQYNYTELAAMREANPQRVYYLYIINSNTDPPLVAPVGNGFTHEFKYNNNGDKIAITGHRLNHHNQNPAYTIPNPANNNTPPAIEVANNFYNPAPGVSREFRDIADMMGNLQMGGSGIKSTIEGNSCDFLPHHKLCKGGGRKRRRKSRRKSRRRMRGKRKGKSRRKSKRKR